jgi:hypothetical protein
MYRPERDALRINSWDAAYRWYRLYGHCEFVAAAEAYTESVGGLLVDHWRDLPQAAALIGKDWAFRRFVVGSVNVILGMKDVEAIRTKAASACPSGLQSLCAELIKQADIAIAEDADLHLD